MLPKRILFYTDTPLLGGAENQMFLLAKFLPKDRYSVSLACSGYKNLNGWCQDFMEIGAHVTRIKVLHKHDPRHFYYLKKILPNFDILHLHIWNPASCRYGFLAVTKKTPLILTEHDPFPMKGLKGWLKKQFFKKVETVITASEAAKKLVLAQEPSLESRIKVIHNGIDIDVWKCSGKLDERADFRRLHYKIQPNEKVILCVAELHERKGQKYLIEAMKNVAKDFPNAKLVFIGDGPARKHYEKLARPLGDRVLFLGRRKEIEKFMAAADFFVLPSVREAFGLVILEAALSNLPTIASSVGGISEIVENGKTGILVPPEDMDALAKAIKFYLTQPQKAAEFAKAAKNRVELLFSAKTMAEKTAEVYDKALHC